MCAHSYGGAVVSQAVTQLTNVGHLVYLAAFVNAGDASALTDRPISLLEAIVPAGEQCSFDPRFAQSIFYGDSEPETVAAIAPRLRPMVLDAAAMVATPSVPRTVPSTYVVCSRDGAIPPEAQLQMAQGLDRVVVWPTDHSPFLTRPGDVADLLELTLHARTCSAVKRDRAADRHRLCAARRFAGATTAFYRCRVSQDDVVLRGCPCGIVAVGWRVASACGWT